MRAEFSRYTHSAFAAQHLSTYTLLADAKDAIEIAGKQLEASLKFKQGRMEDIKKSEEIYLGKSKPVLSGRFSIPVDSVVMKGYGDTLLAKTDEPIAIKFKETREEGLKAAQKMTAAWNLESKKDRWAYKDRLSKKFAYFSGVAILKFFAYSKPEYKSCLQVIDHYDFHCEPSGGQDLENHLFCGVTNIYKTKQELVDGANAGRYDKGAVNKLVNGEGNTEKKEDDIEYNNRQARYQALGMVFESNNYVGTEIYNLTEWILTMPGGRYYLLFDPRSLEAIRFVPLKEMFESNLYPYVAWHTHEAGLFWSTAFADGIRPIAESIRIFLSQTMENIQKRNWDMKLFNTKHIQPKDLLYKEGGLVGVRNFEGMQNIANTVLQLQTPDTTSITLNMLQFLRGWTGTDTGITPAMQGEGKEDKVGIYFGNVQQAQERFGLLNKSYGEAHEQLGIRYDWGAYENMPESFAVKLIGLEGIEWEESIKKEDKEHDFEVQVENPNANAEKDALKNQIQNAAFDKVLARPELFMQVNPKWLTENILRMGQLTEEQIRVAMDVMNYGDQMILAEAAQAIKDIVKGERPEKLNRRATTGFVEKILHFEQDTDDLDEEVRAVLLAYAQAHIQIAQQNMVRKATGVLMQGAMNGMNPLMGNTAPAPAMAGAPMQ